MSDTLNYRDVETNIKFSDDLKQLHLTKRQEVPDDYLKMLADMRHDSSSGREGEFMMVASVPAALAEKWMLEGFNAYDPNVSVKDILARLRLEDMGKLITTTKSL